MVARDYVCNSYFQNTSGLPIWGTSVPQTLWFRPALIISKTATADSDSTYRAIIASRSKN